MPYSHPFSEAVGIAHWKAIADPAAGAEATIPVPAAPNVEPQIITFTFAADANAANRVIYIALSTGGTEQPISLIDAPVTANQTLRVVAHNNAPLQLQTPVYAINMALPKFRIQDTTADLLIKVENIQVGDQISDVFLHSRLWLGASG